MNAWLRWAAGPTRAPWLVACVAALVFAASIGGGYVLDDAPALLRHPVVNGEAPLWEAFTRAYWGEPLGGDAWSSSYRPLTTLSYAIEHRLTASAWLHRGVNLVIYGATCALVTAAARRWMRERLALVMGLVFACLPVHAENVASIVGRADLLAVAGAIGALCLALPVAGDGRAPRDASWGRAAGAASLYLVALLCKETVALLPAVVWWLSWLRWREDPERKRAVPQFRAAAMVSLVGIAYIVARQQVLDVGLPPWFNPADNPLVEVTGLRRVWGQFALLGRYAEVTFVPIRLCADHTYGDLIPPTGLIRGAAPFAWLGVLVAALMLWDGVEALRGRGRGLGVALALSYALIGNFVIDLSVIMAERLVAWPSVWLVWWIGATVDDLELPEAARARLRVLCAVLLLMAGARAVDRALDWRDEVTLQRSSLEACPAAVHGRLNLAMALHARGEAERAVWHFAVAAAGRGAYPGPFDVPAFEAERTEPLSLRLQRLPQLVGAADKPRYWAALYGYFVNQGFTAEAAVVARLARPVAHETPPEPAGAGR